MYSGQENGAKYLTNVEIILGLSRRMLDKTLTYTSRFIDYWTVFRKHTVQCKRVGKTSKIINSGGRKVLSLPLAA